MWGHATPAFARTHAWVGGMVRGTVKKKKTSTTLWSRRLESRGSGTWHGCLLILGSEEMLTGLQTRDTGKHILDIANGTQRLSEAVRRSTGLLHLTGAVTSPSSRMGHEAQEATRAGLPYEKLHLFQRPAAAAELKPSGGSTKTTRWLMQCSADAMNCLRTARRR